MNAPLPIPQPDRAAILEALTLMFDPADVIELRAFHKGKKRTEAGYFDGDHREALADAAVRLNAAGAAVYVTLNRIDPQLLARYCNRMESYASATATDANVIGRRWLLIDFDPVRPKDTSATEAQLTAAMDRARACYQALKADGWPEPLAGESGNGCHLLYPIDLPNDSESRDLVKGALAGLANEFDDEAVTVDQAVFNAGRITKLFGTVATKGDHTPLAPWRLSQLLSKPSRGAVVTAEALRALQPAERETRLSDRSHRRDSGPFDLSAFLSRLGIDYHQDIHEGRKRYRLAHCPFNPDHGNGEAAIFQADEGPLGFKCQHASCADKTWQDVRALVDGHRESRPGRAFEPIRGDVLPARAVVKPEGGHQEMSGGTDHHRNAPRPNEEMLYGLAGDVGRAAASGTEANPYAVAMGYLTMLSASVGRDTYLPIGNTWHHPRFFSLHVGRTGRGRKGDALSLPRRIRRFLNEYGGDALLGQIHDEGLSSREGLVCLIRDETIGPDGEVADPGIPDKRLWVVESEFANVLHQAKRDGNTLSAALRDAWDGVSIKPATKNNRTWATDPHIAISAAITPGELLGVMATRELSNGFANRFVIFWAERERIEPFPQPTSVAVVNELAMRTREVIEFAKGSYPARKDARRMELSAEARTQYEQLYRGELNRFCDGPKVDALLERRAPYLLRLAMLFALADKTLVIEAHHISAALAWVRYWRDSVRFIFQDGAGEDEAAATQDTARAIVAWLQEHGETSRTDLYRECFKSHVQAKRIDAALSELLSETPPLIEVLDGERQANGKRIKKYRVCLSGVSGLLGSTTQVVADARTCALGVLGITQEAGSNPSTPDTHIRALAETRADTATTPNKPGTQRCSDDWVEVEI